MNLYRTSKPIPKPCYRLTTTDPALLSKYLQEIEPRVWIGGNLIFMNGVLKLYGNERTTDKTIETIHGLTRAGLMEKGEV